MLMAFQPARSVFNSAFPIVDPTAVLYQPQGSSGGLRYRRRGVGRPGKFG